MAYGSKYEYLIRMMYYKLRHVNYLYDWVMSIS